MKEQQRGSEVSTEATNRSPAERRWYFRDISIVNVSDIDRQEVGAEKSINWPVNILED